MTQTSLPISVAALNHSTCGDLSSTSLHILQMLSMVWINQSQTNNFGIYFIWLVHFRWIKCKYSKCVMVEIDMTKSWLNWIRVVQCKCVSKKIHILTLYFVGLCTKTLSEAVSMLTPFAVVTCSDPINDVIFSECENKLFRNLLTAIIIIQHFHTFIIMKTAYIWYCEMAWKGTKERTPWTNQAAACAAINNSYPKLNIFNDNT